ncbi:MAG: hypothetical protein WCC90_22100, partial [Methylocella sp.]
LADASIFFAMRAGPRSPIEIISRLMPALIQKVWHEQSSASRQALLFGPGLEALRSSAIRRPNRG